jgi:predicted Zn-dependent protease
MRSLPPYFPLCSRLLAAALLLALARSTATAHATHEARVARIAEQLAQRPNDPALHFEMAEANVEHGDWEVALINLSEVDRLAPGAFPTALRRADAFIVGGRPQSARKVLDPWLAEHPGQPGALLLSARVFQRLGETERALAEFRAAFSFLPNPEPDVVLEVADLLITRGENEAALKLLAEHVARLGPIPTLMLRALDLELAASDFDAAVERVETLRDAAAVPEPWMARRAEILAQAGRQDEARTAWQALLEHLVELPPVQRNSHAFLQLRDQAQAALATLPTLPPAPKSLTASTPSHP